MEVVFEGASFGYRRRRLFDDLHLTFPAGRSILLGPNGAGKSTLLAIAAGVLTLDKGTVSIGGVRAASGRALRDYRRRAAWMPQTVSAVTGLSVREQVAFHAWLGGAPRTRAWDLAGEALADVDLFALAGSRSARLSGGQRARMGLAQALARAADVLLLDEPTAALDPDQKEAFGRLLADVGSDHSVVVSTHEIDGLDERFDHVVVLDGGRVGFAGTVGEFLALGEDAVGAYRAVLGPR